jgi:hypothetical protein
MTQQEYDTWYIVLYHLGGIVLQYPGSKLIYLQPSLLYFTIQVNAYSTHDLIFLDIPVPFRIENSVELGEPTYCQHTTFCIEYSFLDVEYESLV